MLKNQDSKNDRRRFTDGSDDFATILGPGVTFEGRVSGAGNVEIEGSLEGEMAMEGLVWIRQGGAVKGDLEATSVVVEGEVQGNIRSTGKVDLREGCRMKGDITAGTVAAAEGSYFEGKIAMPNAPQPEIMTYTEKRQADSDEEV